MTSVDVGLSMFYFYGAVLFGTRYILLFDETVLDDVKGSLTFLSSGAECSPPASQAHAFVASEPGSNTSPGFEAAAAALQRHLGGTVINNIRGSFGLEIQPVILSLDTCSKDCEILTRTFEASNSSDAVNSLKRNTAGGCWKGDSLRIGTCPKWYILQSWRQGQFGQYYTPDWPKYKSTTDALLNASIIDNTRRTMEDTSK